MNTFIKGVGLSGAIVLAGAISASAALLDFTNETGGTYDTQTAAIATGTLANGTTWVMDALPAGRELSYFSNGPSGAPSTSPLAGENDGVGVQKVGEPNDEITFPLEMIMLTFSQTVRVNTLYFLDLFIAGDLASNEQALVSVDGGANHVFDAESVYPGFGFGDFDVALVGKSFKFSAANTNDDVSKPDYALAGLDVSPVPLPAGLLLLGTALAGFGVARRRK